MRVEHHSKALAQIVFGTMKCRRVSQADIGRAMETDTVPKYNIKRVSRFITNKRVNVAKGCRGLARIAAKASGGCLVVAVDWVDIGKYKVLKAAVPIRGRAVPILFAAYPKWKLKKSQNQFEEALFDLLSKLVPARTWTAIVADRGFARAELVSFLRELKMNHVIRVSSGATFRSEKFSGRLSGHGVKEGGHRVLGWGRYTARHPVERRVIVRWERGHEEPLVLGTDLPWNWRKVVEVFKRRMSIEELFRDEKPKVRPFREHKVRLGTATAEDKQGRAVGEDVPCAGLRVPAASGYGARVPRHYVRGALGFGDHENEGPSLRFHDWPVHADPREVAPGGGSGGFRADAHPVGRGELGMTQAQTALTGAGRANILLPRRRRRPEGHVGSTPGHRGNPLDQATGHS
jgi:hypothetical protein